MRLQRKYRAEYRRFNKIDFYAPVIYNVYAVPVIILNKLFNIIAKMSGSFANSDRADVCREINADLRAVEEKAAMSCGEIERPQEDNVYYPECGFVWNGNIQLTG